MPIGGVINRNYNVFCFVVDPVLAYFLLILFYLALPCQNNDKHKGQKRDKTWLRKHSDYSLGLDQY